jgi:hypothetical protein
MHHFECMCKNYEEGQYSYFQLLNIKSVSALHFQLFASMHLHDSLFIYILLHIICTEMHIKIWRSIKRHVLKRILVLIYPLVSKLYSIAVIQPLSTAEVERLFSQVALIKTSHRANIKTETTWLIVYIHFITYHMYRNAH